MTMKKCDKLECQRGCKQYIPLVVNKTIEHCSHWRKDILGADERICDAPNDENKPDAEVSDNR